MKTFAELEKEFQIKYNHLKPVAYNAKFSDFIRKDKEFIESILFETSYLPIESTINFRIQCLKLKLMESPKCNFCGKKVKEIKKYCSIECRDKDRSNVQKNTWNKKTPEEKSNFSK